MIELVHNRSIIEEIGPENPRQLTEDNVFERPEVVDAKVYKLKSGFVSHSVYVTLGYIRENDHLRPIEIFINSKDLTKAAEYAMLTRLISAIFRKSSNPRFILEELNSIHDPNGGYIRRTGYVHSFYSEIAEVIERFFEDLEKMQQAQAPVSFSVEVDSTLQNDVPEQPENNVDFKICPQCQQRTLRLDNGCPTCINPKCNYSKCG